MTERAKRLGAALAGYTGNMGMMREGAIRILAADLTEVAGVRQEELARHFDAHPDATFSGAGVAAAIRALK